MGKTDRPFRFTSAWCPLFFLLFLLFWASFPLLFHFFFELSCCILFLLFLQILILCILPILSCSLFIKTLITFLRRLCVVFFGKGYLLLEHLFLYHFSVLIHLLLEITKVTFNTISLERSLGNCLKLLLYLSYELIP